MEPDIVVKLRNFDTSTATLQEFRDLVQHLQDQMNNTYVYWVGEWADGKRARSTRNGQFISKEEVINYLNGGN
ncbi:MAG: hypothetical protein LBQ94_11280 [Treponema sp.]|jgi:hypothetical protein|nr:hypothetical protein [Treponema sp.]